MGFGNRLAEGQTDAGMAAVAGTAAGGAVEAVEDVRQVRGGDPGAVVGDGERRGGGRAAEADLDSGAGRRVLDGVPGQVEDQAEQLAAVAAERTGGIGQFEDRAFGFGKGTEGFGCLAGEFPEV